MTISNVLVGLSPNDGTGDPLRTAFQKINDNFWYLEDTKGTGGTGSGGVNLTGYATTSYVNTVLSTNIATVSGVNLSALNNALANVYAVNLDNLNNALANVNSVNLDRLNNALANVNSVNLDRLNNALANVNSVNLDRLNNALANLSLVNLNNLGNALAQIDFSLLSNVSNLVSTISANAPAKVNIVSNLSTPGSTTGQTVLNNSDNKLYVWNGTAWTSTSAFFTPNANSISGVQVVDTLPATNNFEGRQVLYSNALYIYNNGSWKSATEVLTPTASSISAVEIFTGASLPATSAAESGRTLFWTNQSNLYINVGGAWNNYNSYIQGTGSATIGAGSVNSAAIVNGAITADKIASGAVIAGKIAAGAISATEIAANAITADKILANAVTAGKIAAGAIKADQLDANAITSEKIAASAIVAGKIAAGAISATEIAAGAIGADQIAANAIVSSKIAAANIFAINLAANAVTANAIEAFAITADKIRANAIQSYHLTANSVTANAIESNSITAAMIRANAITSVQIAALSVYAGAIQANSITSDKIFANAITSREIAASSVYAGALQANSVTAATIAANAITAVQLAANAVYANAIQANAIESNKIAANAITAVQLAANSVYAGALQANSITTNSLAANAITAKHIGANVITANMIDGRGLVIRNSAGSVLLGDGVLANTLVVVDSTGTPKTLAQVASPSGQNAIQFIGSYASNAAADAAGAVVNSVYKNTSDNKNYIKQNNGTWIVFVENGAAGTAGNNSYTALIFRQNATNPGAPTGGTYNFNTNTFTPPANWTTAAPVTSTTPTWATNYTYIGTGTVTAGTWETPYEIARQRADGTSVFGASVFLQSSGTPSAPSGGSYNFSTNTLTAPAGWSIDIPTASIVPTWIANFIFSTTTVGSTVTAGTWINIRKIVQSGAAGNNGVRGNLRVAQAVSFSFWDNGTANSAITNLASDGVVRDRDEVTLYNTSTGFSETRFWTGSSWSTIAAYINGGLVVNGTIGTNQLTAGAITAEKIAARSITADKLCSGSITTNEISNISGGVLDYNSTSPSRFSSGDTPTMNNLGSFSLGSSRTFNGFQASGSFNSSGNGSALLGFSSYNGSFAFAIGGVATNTNYGGIFASTGTSGFDGFHSLVAIGYRDYAALFRGLYSPYSSGNNLNNCFRGEVYIMSCPNTNLITGNPYEFLIAGQGYGYNSEVFPSYRPLGCPQVLFGIGLTGSAALAMGAVFTLNCQTNVNQVKSKILLAYDGYAAYGQVGKMYSVGGFNPFTGIHDGITNDIDNLEPGDILVDYQVLQHIDISNSIVEVKRSTSQNQKNVIGVLNTIFDTPPNDWYNIASPNTTTVNTIVEGPAGENYDPNNIPLVENTAEETIVTPIYDIPEGFKVVHINALGEGLINVCGENGDIEAGDLITTSSIPGKGMKQSDDIIRGYTVAKARESATFSSPTEVKQIAVTYHCG